MSNKLTETLRKLTNREREALSEMRDEVRTPGPVPEDMVRRTVKVGSTELPILNLNGLWALRRLLNGDKNEAEAMLTIVWVLLNQHRPGLVDEVANGIPKAELRELACEIDLTTAADVLAAFEEMVAPFGERNAPERSPACGAEPSAKER
jgi:hypothetical protein